MKFKNYLEALNYLATIRPELLDLDVANVNRGEVAYITGVENITIAHYKNNEKYPIFKEPFIDIHLDDTDNCVVCL